MSHLHPERLAALADEDPTSVEALHLAECGACARERDAYRRLVAIARLQAEAAAAPLTSWDSLGSALRDEGLVAEPAGGVLAFRGGRPLRARGQLPWWLQIAAAVALVAVGALGGRALTTGPGAVASGDTPKPAGPEALTEPTTRAVSDDEALPRFASAAEAIAALRRAERDYRLAMMYLTGQDSVSSPPSDRELYRSRLAALDEVADVAFQAVQRAPHDPVVNQYLLSALGARDMTMRALQARLASNEQLGGF